MGKGRLEAFSDGVFAIIITIMVLELRVPQGGDLAALRPLLPVFLCYTLSFVFVGIYWNNHHHMLQAIHYVNGRTLWANLHLLFWLSLTPFITGWMGASRFAPWPTALYGFVLLLSGVAYTILAKVLVAHHGKESLLAKAIGKDVKGAVSVLCYGSAIPLAFVSTWISCGLYVIVAGMWLIPDRRIEALLEARPK